MGSKQEAPVREVLRILDLGDFRPNLERVTALFREDAWYQVGVPARQAIQGRDAIAGELARQADDYKDCVCEVLTVVSDDRYVITERIDHVTMLHNNVRVHNPLLAIFEIDDDGLIVNWREYWDALSLSHRIGVDPERMQQLMGITDTTVEAGR
ncbi:MULTISPECIES: nuclear transport factor 2 family protein [Gordonia]|uniref:Nuclear transport factor 2 family protein n=1 Tax=Gordonia hongkongensis TaxID=1701090 RepID=A0ABT6BW97_9ACTN|nr:MULTISPECIES: limonene-1,2-epoxide hydrolase family protein [Gordonia]MCT1352006.1 nuclear transport factor 2 family protein [Gordonia sp. p3-SID1431]MDF6102344.1 nuclear transport factor 2 family protein [Gordonia hongkongensis]OCH79214.1 terpene synthase [Gordonia sp. UCD-TK1]UPG67749.1 nuclear transport factor 2 family protein [Gordonia hongkongensis]WGJ85062.1 limonene-1,2-epoxide hydrolase family protein [Gordonia sp. SMJS1]